MRITDLGGHSGCKILLCETNDNKVFVRKISSNKDYNNRLKNQAEKQAAYYSDSIKVPIVFGSGMTEESLFYFDMEYIQGITLSECIKTIEVGKVRNIVESIVESIVSLHKRLDFTDADDMVFAKKIESLNRKLRGQNNLVINEALDILIEHSWHKFVRTACHGDLTLENIIIKDNQLYLIDLLDSFYDCWIMDISTLLQDVQTLWAYRYQEEISNNVLIRLIVFRDVLIDRVKETVGEDYIEVYYALLMKLIRIYPYAKDDKTYQFLNKKTKAVIEIIKEEVRCRL